MVNFLFQFGNSFFGKLIRWFFLIPLQLLLLGVYATLLMILINFGLELLAGVYHYIFSDLSFWKGILIALGGFILWSLIDYLIYIIRFIATWLGIFFAVVCIKFSPHKNIGKIILCLIGLIITGVAFYSVISSDHHWLFKTLACLQFFASFTFLIGLTSFQGDESVYSAFDEMFSEWARKMGVKETPDVAYASPDVYATIEKVSHNHELVEGKYHNGFFRNILQFYKLNNPCRSNGRLGRLGFLFWSFIGPILIIALVGILSVLMIGGPNQLGLYVSVGGAIVFAVMSGLAFMICIVAHIKRLHDLNLPGAHIVWCFIPIVNIGFIVYLLFVPGAKGENDYGAPRKTPTWEKAMLGVCILLLLLRYGIAILPGTTNQSNTRSVAEKNIEAVTQSIQDQASSQWGVYQPQDQSFKILLPNIDQVTTQKTEEDGIITVEYNLLDSSDFYKIADMTIPSETSVNIEMLSMLAKAIVQSFMEDQKNSTIGDIEITLDPSRSMSVFYKQKVGLSSGTHMMQGKIFSPMKGKIYALLTIYPVENEDVETKKFINSFELTLGN